METFICVLEVVFISQDVHRVTLYPTVLKISHPIVHAALCREGGETVGATSALFVLPAFSCLGFFTH